MILMYMAQFSKKVACSENQTPSPHTVPTVRPPTTYHENYTS